VEFGHESVIERVTSRRVCGPASLRRLKKRIWWPATSSDAGAATGTHVALKAASLAAGPGRGPCASLTGNGAASRIGFVLAGSGNSSVVEHRLAKARVAGSNPVSRSKTIPLNPRPGDSKGVCPLRGVTRRVASARGVRDARNNERHVCGRRRDGEAAGSSMLGCAAP
jgi:hypothetical protein